MTNFAKIAAVLPLTILLGACVGANDPVDTNSELEATLDQDIDQDGTIPQGGVEVGAPN
ncbi:hypothetical protein [Jannaschia sp. 2305UL9-9]|uniref:hypothetical protein n=1 Tax=Jannaschia sp. 2305UL9-9 TaxID=3121638 RepID=UPI003528F718